MLHRSPLIPLVLSLAFLSCTSTRAPIYNGPLLGDSLRIFPLPFPVNTKADEFGATVSYNSRWMFFSRASGEQYLVYRMQIDSGYAPMVSGAVERFLPSDLTLAFVAPGRTDGQYITVGCRMSEGVGSCDLYELILTEEMTVRMFTNLSRLNSVRWESFPAVSRSGKELWFSRIRGSALYYSTSIYRSAAGISSTHADLMVSTYGNDGWDTPTWGDDSINSLSDEISPAFGFRDSAFFFSSDRPGGFGGHDIYVSFRKEDGTWGSPLNLGRPINSEADEYGLTPIPDSPYLLLSSDRKSEGAQGGLDLYIVEIIGSLR